MTAEKLIFLVFTAALFILAVSIYSKTMQKGKKRLLSSFLGSAGLGALSLSAVLIFELFCGELISLNLCTVSASLLLSAPATIAMLFINII
ncbi:MAG: hypothetical protein IJY33_05015 [Oscillospiraceae bacterium]|nr:hypothetical protein [Oscillospiraceae bacterium]